MPGYQGDPGETIMGALHMPSYELEDNSMVIFMMRYGETVQLVTDNRTIHYSWNWHVHHCFADCKQSSN